MKATTMVKIINILVFGSLLYGLSFTFGTTNVASKDASCDLKTQCLNDAVSCLSGESLPNKSQVAKELAELKKEVASLKAKLATAGKPGGFAMLDSNGHIPQNLLVAGYDKHSAYDLAWQSLHMAAAAACRGSTPSGGTGCCGNTVLVRNTASGRTCAQICALSNTPKCDAEVSIYGKEGKAKGNGERVGYFYNYNCGGHGNGGSEASNSDDAVMSPPAVYFGFCCCRK